MPPTPKSPSMSLRLPHADIQIHLSTSTSSSAEEVLPGTTNATRSKCTICHIHPSPYTCPTCNIPYCSLACFKNEKKHGGCLGSFQKRGEDELRKSSRSDGNDEERERVMDMLRRWQLGNVDSGEGLNWQSILEGEDGEDEDDGEDYPDDSDGQTPNQDTPHRTLTEDDLPTDEAQLLALLNDDQRRIFLDAVNLGVTEPNEPGVHSHPAGSERAQQLWDKVHSANASHAPRLWWNSEESDPQQPVTAQSTFTSSVDALVTAQSQSQFPWRIGVSWNILALLLAYVYTLVHLDLRSLNAGADAQERIIAKETISQLCPLLAAPKGSHESRTLLTNASEVTLYLLDQLGEEHRSQSPSALVLFLYKHVVELLNRSRIASTSGDMDTDKDKDTVTLALQDIHDLFNPLDQTTARKIIFYAAHYQRARPLFRNAILGSDERDGHPATTPRMTIHEEMKALQEEVDAGQAHERFDAAFAWQVQAQAGDKDRRPPLSSSSSTTTTTTPLIQPVDQTETQSTEPSMPTATQTQTQELSHRTASSSFKSVRNNRQMRHSANVSVFQPTAAQEDTEHKD